MKYSTTALVTLLLLALLFGGGCSDEPNAVGIKLLPPQDSLRVATSTASATSAASFLSRVRGVSTTLAVGRSNGIESRAMLYFAGLAGIPVSAVVDSAVLTLPLNYRFRDSSGILGFEVRKMLRPFTAATFTWDSTNAAGIYSDTVSGAFLRGITSQDDSLNVRIDTALVNQWRQTNIGSMILLPALGATTCAGISNVTSLSYLTISYHDTADTALPALKYYSSAGLFVADGALPALPASFVLQAGVVYREVLHFDSLSVPPKASITQALLEVSLDTSSSLTNSQSVDNIVVYLERKSVSPYDSVALGTTCLPAYVGAQKIYRGDVKAIVQQWFIHEPNNGILLRAGGELTTLDRFAIFGPGASAALRPRLKITYTILP